MIEIAQWYISVGCAIYLVCFLSAVYKREFRPQNLFFGFLGILFWPVVVHILREKAQ